MSYSKHLYFPLSRRRFIKGTGATAMILGAPAILKGLTRRAKADYQPGVIRALFTGPTVVPGNWDQFEAETGLKMEHTIIKDDPGLFLNEIMVNDGGDRYDIITTLAGVQGPLVEGGYITPLETGKMSNWEGVSTDVRDNPLIRTEDGSNWGVPMLMNADTFGYYPAELNEPRPPEEASWALIFDSEKTRGRASVDDIYFTLTYAGAYLKAKNMAQIGDPANMAPNEITAAADYMIERKKAGQFRAFWSTFDDQITMFSNKEVLAMRCWEPAVREMKKQGQDIEYAYTPEFYIKWMHANFIPTQAKERGNLDEIYKACNWFLGGTYAAAITPLRGYVTARADLGVETAKERNMGAIVVKEMNDNLLKLEIKFAHPLMWFNAVPDYLAEHQEAMDRVLNV